MNIETLNRRVARKMTKLGLGVTDTHASRRIRRPDRITRLVLEAIVEALAAGETVRLRSYLQLRISKYEKVRSSGVAAGSVGTRVRLSAKMGGLLKLLAGSTGKVAREYAARHQLEDGSIADQHRHRRENLTLGRTRKERAKQEKQRLKYKAKTAPIGGLEALHQAGIPKKQGFRVAR